MLKAAQICFPLDPTDHDGYARWRDAKLAGRPRSLDELTIGIDRLAKSTRFERAAIMDACRRANFAIYHSNHGNVDSATLKRFARALGLTRLDHHLCAEADGIAALTPAPGQFKAGFIPYTHQPLGWHTDGYYHPPDQRIRTVILHCARPAERGGENALLDPDMVYIHIREQSPELVSALKHPACMTIPARQTGGPVRHVQSGPVFGIDAATGRLFMRYTARAKNVIWRDDPLTATARKALADYMASAVAPVFRVRLERGQGIISNNVLHTRSAFEDDADAPRLIYRARFFDALPSQ